MAQISAILGIDIEEQACVIRCSTFVWDGALTRDNDHLLLQTSLKKGQAAVNLFRQVGYYKMSHPHFSEEVYG